MDRQIKIETLWDIRYGLNFVLPQGTIMNVFIDDLGNAWHRDGNRQYLVYYGEYRELEALTT